MPAVSPSAAAARYLVDGLVSAGVTHACITPGSRSTPLTVALARNPHVRPWLHLDERSSAFFALGLARALGAPVALVCTSGTAAANFWPAVVEANLSRIPLIVLTADRPPRLRDVGADQTITQVGMFGANVRWSFDLPVPHGDEGEAAALGARAQRAVRASLGPLPGPVHLNVPYDEPLIDDAEMAPARPGPGPLPESNPLPPARADVEAAVAALRGRRRPMIVAGPETGGLDPESILALARRLGAPVVADPLSGLRTGPHDLSSVLDAADALVRDPRAHGAAPDAVIRFGGVPTSKALNQYLARLHSAAQLLCDSPGSWRDPEARASLVIQGDPELTAVALGDALAGFEPEPGWREGWLDRSRRARSALRSTALEFAEMFEGRVFIELQENVPPGATILAGNSMPVRDMDAFLECSPKPLHPVSNRGANGIDGVVSSALGTAAAEVGPVFLVIGDISFYHDLNGLWAALRHNLNLTILLVNNDGGGIFHYLPQAAYPDVFETWFGTPSGLDFAPAVGMYGGRHTVVTSWEAFRSAVSSPPEGLHVVELRTDRARNVEMHAQAWGRAAVAAWEDSGEAQLRNLGTRR